MDVPTLFEMETEAIDAAVPAKTLGFVTAQGHPLSGMWILLTQRHVEADGCFNLAAYTQRPISPAVPHEISGFAQAKI